MGMRTKDLLEGVEKLTAHCTRRRTVGPMCQARSMNWSEQLTQSGRGKRLLGATNVGKRLKLRIDDDTGNVYADDEHMYIVQEHYLQGAGSYDKEIVKVDVPPIISDGV